MKAKSFGLPVLAGLALLGLAACNSPTGAGSASTGTGTTTTTSTATATTAAAAAATATALVAAIPDMGNLLPKSLQAGAAASSRSASRALNDVTALTPSLLPGVTANGYKQFKDNLSNSMFSQIMTLLKLGLSGKTLALDTDFRLGTVTLPDSFPGPDPTVRTMDLGVIRISKPDAATTTFKWYIRVKQTMGGASVTIPYYLFIRITGNDSATMKVALTIKGSIAMGTSAYSMNQVVSYDASTREMTSITPPGGPSGASIQALGTSNGFVRFYSLYADGSKQVAYASDTMGGVVNASSYQGRDNINTEFYNDKGDLVMTQWGTADLSSYSWMTDQFQRANTTNIKSLFATRPETLYRKTVITSHQNAADAHRWDRSISWSADNVTFTTPVTDFSSTTSWPSDGWSNPVWMAGSTPAAGDSMYYQKGCDWGTGSWNSGAQTWTSTSTDRYQVGFTVPAQTSYLGKNYYLSNRFMLKYLDLDPSLAASFSLKMKEGVTSYSYKEANGSWTSATTKPAGWDSLGQWDRNTWTNFSYWLENGAYRDKDGAATNSAASQDPDKGDLPLNNLREDSFYFWENGTGKVVKAQVLDTTEAAPVGFTFQCTSLVNSVRTAIEDYYQNQVPAFDAASLQARANAIITMPDTGSFPSY